MILKKILPVILAGFLSAPVFAASDDFIYVLNPDAYSQSIGASILALSPSVFGFFTNPASNYKNISKEVQLSYYTVYNKNYGANVGLIIPTEKNGNFSITVSGADLNEDETGFKNFLMAAVNYVYPIISKYPVPVEKGSVGATVKFYNISTYADDGSDKSINLFSVDLGCIYSLDFIDNDLTGALTIKNLGNAFEYDDYSVNQAQLLTASARYNLYDLYKVAMVADMVKNLQITDLGYACGVEAVPIYPLSVRVGWRDYRDGFNKGITAGLSLIFDRVNLSYSFSDIAGSDNDQHIFSLGIYFGKIANSGKAYEHYLGYYLNKAKYDYDKKNYVSARKQYEDILAVYPNEPSAKRYVKLLSEDLYQTDMDLSDKTEKYLARADSALLRNNLVKAKNYYEKALELSPRNKQALEGMEKTNNRIREEEIYANRKKHQKEISEHWIKAVKHYDDGEFVYAKDEFNKILEIDPENAGALQYLEFIQKKVDKVTAVQSHNIFKQGLVEYEKQNYEKALSYFNAAYLSNTSRNDIKEYIVKCEEQINLAKQAALEESKNNPNKTLTNKQLEAQMKKIYNLGVEQYTLKDYEEAIKTFTKLKAMSEEHKYYSYNEQIKTYLSKSNKEVSKILYTEGRDLELKEKLTEAYEKYKEALSYDETNSSAKKAMDKINAVTAQKYYDDGLKAFASGDKNKAIELLKKSLEAEPTKIEATRALERIQNLK
ncbi:hypothetical protein [Candidatus Ruminimicrobiellum ovillum]|uniref:hypothetical protein n=1 Tax=Candidatus Ruminimicrobiellum ovillum TaxID=1947927 RepID=UPI00355A6DB6